MKNIFITDRRKNTMRRSYPRIPLIAFALSSQLTFSSAWASSFTVGDGLTVTVAQTLGNAGSETGTVNATGTLSVSGSTVAITISGINATLNNYGTILQTGTGRLIRDNTGVSGLLINNGSLTNSTALMQSADADVIQMNKPVATVTLNNYGTMTSLNASAAGSQVVDFNAITTGANTVNNFATGIIQASQADAVRPGVNGLVNNSGTIISTSTNGSSSDGVDVQSNTGVNVVNANNWNSANPSTPGSGLIEGARHGITGGLQTSIKNPGDIETNDIAFTTTVTNNLGGTIQGDNGSGINLDGLSALQTATVINNGTITGNGHDFSGNLLSRDGDGIDVDGLAYITNTGIIRSINAFSIPSAGVAYSEGITIGGGTITNSGTIEGLVAAGNTNAVGRGITLTGNDIIFGPLLGTREAIYGNAVVTNNAGGLIRGDSDSAIAVEGPASLSGFTVQINNNSGATIRGGGVTNAAIWVRSDNVPANPNITVNNYGSIDGSSSEKAIELGKGDDTVTLFSGSTVNGSMNGGDGNDRLNFNGWRGRLSGSVVNWETIYLTDASSVDLLQSMTEAGQFTMSFNNMSIDATSTLLADGDSPGYYTLVGNITNSGTISLMDNLDAKDRLTITGNYTGGGIIKLDIDSSTGSADHVSISGTVSGTTAVQLNKIGGTTAKPSSPIELISTPSGTGQDAFTFSFTNNAIGAGYYEPQIVFSDGRFDFTGYVLTGYRNEAALMQGVTAFVDRLGFESVTDFHTRHAYEMLACGAKAQPASFWIRGYGSSFRLGQEGDAATSMSGYSLGTQFGGDLTAGRTGESSQYHAGAFGGTGYQKADVKGITTDKAGKLSQQVWNMGLYGSMERPGCYYLEGVLQAGYHDITLNSDDEPGKLNTNTWGLLASLEAGVSLHAGEGFRLDPRAQMIWQHTGNMNLSTSMGDVHINNHNGFMGILGTTGTLTKTGLPFNPFVDVVLTRNFSSNTHVDYAESGTRLSSNPERTQFGGSIGIASATMQNRSLSYFFKAGAMYGLDGHASYGYNCTAGINKVF